MSYYCCNYTTVKDKVKRNVFVTNCFSGVYGSKNYDQIIVYVLKDYKGAHSYTYNMKAEKENSMQFTEKEVKEYHKILQKMGLLVDLDTNHKITIDRDNLKKEYDCYAFTIDCEGNGRLGICFLLNAIRFLYENDMPEMVKKILQWKDEDCCGYYTKFIISFQCKEQFMNENHHMKGSYSIQVPKSDKEFKAICQKDVSNCGSNLPATKTNLTPEEKGEILKMITKNDSFTEIYQKYKQLCEKYS